MIRGVASVLAGFLAMPAMMFFARSVIGALWPDLSDTSYLILNLTLAAMTGMCAAALTARLAPEPPYMWVLVLAFFVFTGGVVMGIQQLGGPVPDWYLLALPPTTGVAMAVGGWAYLLRRET